ncbi:MAG: hypothetical protein Q9227_001303 [Pyrenula ochraceoflavens]
MSSPAHTPRPIVQGIRRSFTAPVKLPPSSVQTPTSADPSDSAAEILYSHPSARIICFSPPAPNHGYSSARNRASSAPLATDFDYPVDAIETLPWYSATEKTGASGSMIIEKISGSARFLKCGQIVHPIMRNSQCWCVDGVSKFVLRVRSLQYYRIELPFEREADKLKVEEFKAALKKVLRYEITPCPFKRGFRVELPVEASTPKKKRAWTPRKSLGSIPDLPRSLSTPESESVTKSRPQSSMDMASLRDGQGETCEKDANGASDSGISTSEGGTSDRARTPEPIEAPILLPPKSPPKVKTTIDTFEQEAARIALRRESWIRRSSSTPRSASPRQRSSSSISAGSVASDAHLDQRKSNESMSNRTEFRNNVIASGMEESGQESGDVEKQISSHGTETEGRFSEPELSGTEGSLKANGIENSVQQPSNVKSAHGENLAASTGTELGKSSETVELRRSSTPSISGISSFEEPSVALEGDSEQRQDPSHKSLSSVIEQENTCQDQPSSQDHTASAEPGEIEDIRQISPRTESDVNSPIFGIPREDLMSLATGIDGEIDIPSDPSIASSKNTENPESLAVPLRLSNLDTESTASSIASFHSVAPMGFEDQTSNPSPPESIQLLGEMPATQETSVLPVPDPTREPPSLAVGPNTSDPRSEDKDEEYSVEDFQEINLIPPTPSSTTPDWPNIAPSSPVDTIGPRRRTLKPRRSLSPMPHPSTLLASPSSQSPVPTALIQRLAEIAIGKPFEAVSLLVRIIGRIAAGATVADLISGDLFRRPDQISVTDDPVDSGDEDDFGIPIRGRDRSRDSTAHRRPKLGTRTPSELD